MMLLTLFRRFASNRRRSRLLQLAFLVVLFTVASAKSTAESTTGNLREMANLTCLPGKHIVVHLANFGRFSLQPCNPTMNLEINTQCQNDNTMPLLKQRCDSQRECSFAVTTTLFGDACPENAKYLETRYDCVEDGGKFTINTIIHSLVSTTSSTATPDPPTPRPADHQNEATPSGVEDLVTPKEHCTTRFSRYLLWPKTSSGHLSKLPCPAGTSGSAEWLCSSTGEWFPMSGPDLSGCVSDWSRELKTDAAQRDPRSQAALLRELYTSIRREQLVGGDLVNVVNVLSTTIDSYGSTTTSSSADGGEIMKVGVDVIGFLLTGGQRATWMDLPAGERRQQAATLLRTVHSMLRIPEKNGFFVSEFDTTTFKLFSTHIPMAGDGADESTSADDIVSLPPSLLSSNYGEGALPVYGYASMQRIADYLDSLNRMDTGHKIVSQVVALSLPSGEDATTSILDEPITIFFHISRQGVLDEPLECMWWDSTRLAWMSSRPRTQRGCWLAQHNSTHSGCECNILSAYVVATIGSGHYWLAHYWVTTNLVVYASCLIAIILFLLVLVRLLRWMGRTEAASVNNPAKRMHLLNFVLCWLGTELLISAIYTGSEEWALCAWLVVILRCIVLSTLCWMLLATVALYHRTLSAHLLQSSRQRKDLIGGADQPDSFTTSKVFSYGFAYGFPSALTFAAVIWDWGSTSRGECRVFLSSAFAMMTFLLPVSLLLLCVIAYTAATLCSLCRYPRMGSSTSYGHHKPSAKKLFDPFTLQSLRGVLKFNLLVTILIMAYSTFGILWALEAVGGVHSETSVNCAAILFGLLNLLLAAALFCFLPGRVAKSCNIGVGRWMPNRLLNGAALSGDEKERNNSLNSGHCNLSTSPLGRGDATASTGTTSAASSDVSESPMLTAVDTMERSRQGIARSRVYVGHGSMINSPPYHLRSPHYCTRPGTLIATGTLPYVASGCHRHGYGRGAPDFRGGSEEMLLPGQRYHASQQREPSSIHYGDGNGTYDYATIPYDDDYIVNAEACQRHYLSHPYHYRRQAEAEGAESTCRSIRVEIPRVPHMGCQPQFCSANCSTARIVPATRDAVQAMMLGHCNGSSSHLHVQPLQPNHDHHQTEESQGGMRSARGQFRSAPPPEFPPPPPPEEAVAMAGNCDCDCSPDAAGEDVALMADGRTQMNPCSSSVQLRQSMQRVGSVNSGASSLGSSPRCGILVLKMDLSRWPPVYSEIQESDAEEMQ